MKKQTTGRQAPRETDDVGMMLALALGIVFVPVLALDLIAVLSAGIP